MSECIIEDRIVRRLTALAQDIIANNWQLPDDNWQWVSSSGGSKVARFIFDNQEYYFKAFLPRDSFETIKSFIRGNRARRFWTQSNNLEQQGFSVPKVITANVYGVMPWIIMKSVSGIAWGDYLCSFLTHPKTFRRLRWKRELIRALGTEVGRLHGLGFLHGDLNPFNVLIDTNQTKPKFHLIDNERSRRPFYLLERERIRNLIQINFFRSPQFQRTDHLRFWISYCEAAKIPEPKKRQLGKKAYAILLRRLSSRGYNLFGNSSISPDEVHYLPN